LGAGAGAGFVGLGAVTVGAGAGFVGLGAVTFGAGAGLGTATFGAGAGFAGLGAAIFAAGSGGSQSEGVAAEANVAAGTQDPTAATALAAASCPSSDALLWALTPTGIAHFGVPEAVPLR